MPEQALNMALDNLGNQVSLRDRLRQGWRRHRLCALRPGPSRPCGHRRPPLLSRSQARQVRLAAGQGPARCRARPLWRPMRAPALRSRPPSMDFKPSRTTRRLLSHRLWQPAPRHRRGARPRGRVQAVGCRYRGSDDAPRGPPRCRTLDLDAGRWLDAGWLPRRSIRQAGDGSITIDGEALGGPVPIAATCRRSSTVVR